MLLSEDETKGSEAETCLLTAVMHQPRWVEGWTALLLLYQVQNNIEGVELCEEMAELYLDDPCSSKDKLSETDDLAWSALVVPSTKFFKIATLLIKMRVFKVEKYNFYCFFLI